MPITDEFIDYLKDLFSVVPGTSIRKMFGGVGIFRHGIMFAVSLDDGRIAFKADDQTIPEFEQENCSQWVYEKAKKRISMGYWYVPEFIVDDMEMFEEWALKAFEAAVRTNQKKPPSQRKLKI